MIVADCSAVIFYLTDDGPAGQQAREHVRREDSLAAPGLLDYEVMSVLVGLSRGRRGGEPKLGKRQAEKAMARSGCCRWTGTTPCRSGTVSGNSQRICLPMTPSTSHSARPSASRC